MNKANKKAFQGGEIVKFIRQNDYKFKKEIGQGACGVTVLLHDTQIDENFVCKKYSPAFSELNAELFSNFINEIKLLYKVNHPNIVRVFNYHIYCMCFFSDFVNNKAALLLI